MKKTPRDKLFFVQEYFATLFSSPLRRRVFAGSVVVLLLTCAFLFSSKGLLKRFELSAENARLQRQLTHEKAQQDSLRTYRDQLQRDTFMIEKTAREQYGMIRPGETVYRIPAQSDVDKKK